MVGGTTPPQSDSREISRVLVLNLSGKASGAHAPPRRGLSLTTPSLLSRWHPGTLGSKIRKKRLGQSPANQYSKRDYPFLLRHAVRRGHQRLKVFWVSN